MALHEALAQCFSLDELKTLCLNAGIDPESVPFMERGKEVYAYSLVRVFQSQNNLALLRQACAKVRPAVNWTAYQDAVPAPAAWAELFGEAVYNVAGLPNPYLGLRAFTFDDREAYAGRRRLVDEAVAHLTTPGQPQVFLFITGASGSGKSSFAQAGVVPALEAHYAKRGSQHRPQLACPPTRQTRPQSRFDAAVYKHQFCAEHTFAWIDKLRALLVRYDRCASHFMGAHFIAFALINLRVIFNPNWFQSVPPKMQ